LTAPDPAKKLASLIKKLRSEHPEPCTDAGSEGRPEGADPLAWQLVFAFLAWEASTQKAGAACKRLHAAVVDYNEMRVCLADELMHLIGDRYPRGHERVQRLRSSLNDLYRREHSVTLQRLVDLPKRDARAYLDSLDGMPPYVAARMTLLAFGGHAFPVDERIYLTLLEEGAAPEDLTVEDASGWLERQFRAGEVLEPYLLLESWLNDRPAPKPRKPVARKDEPKPRAEEPRPERPKPAAAATTKPKKTSKS
jgi:hypothetical protein